MEIERKLLKVTLSDIKKYVYIKIKSLKGNTRQYVMLENDFKGQIESNAELYIDQLGLDKSHCTATLYAAISPMGTFHINKDICGEEDLWVEYEDFCKMLYEYIVEEYQYVLKFKENKTNKK